MLFFHEILIIPAIKSISESENEVRKMRYFFCLCILFAVCASISLGEDTVPGAETSAVSSDFVIGLEDVLGINVWKEPELSMGQVAVRPDGCISLPLVGDMKASGLTPLQLKKNIEEKLKKFLASPTVTVIVLQIKSQNVSIVGEVSKPGVYYMGSPMTILELLSRAGGFLQFSDKKNILIIRKKDNSIQNFNYEDVSKGRNISQNIVLENGDIVIVP